jgi:hypothetical protein
MSRRGWPAIALAGVFLGTVSGNWIDTWAGIDVDKLPHFPLTKIRSGSLESGSRLMFDSISATAGSAYRREVQLRGSGKLGKRWEAHIFDLDQVWRADLDGNGTPDYVLFATGPYFNGRTTPPFSFSILLMDREGMPVPFFTVAYHGENDEGLEHLVDLNRDGHAELLISTYDEIASDAYVGGFCSGHWTNQLYRFTDFGAEEFRGTMGGITFPLIHDWSYRGTQCAEEEKPFLPVSPATLYEHGTGKQGRLETAIRKVDPVTGLITIEPVAGCKAITAQVIVYDRPRVREIAFPNPFHDDSTGLADRIRRDRAPVELRGVDRWMGNGDCAVNLMWAGNTR